MSKVKILTPVHVGSGNTYYVAYQKDNYIYSLENIIETLDPSEVNNQKLLINLQNSKNLSRDEFISNFKFDISKLNPQNSIGKVNDNSISNIKGYVYEMTRSGNQLIIPGSTIKGYVTNVLYFDIIQNNSNIRTYLENKFKNIYDKYKNEYFSFKEEKNNKQIISILKKVSKDISKELSILENEIKYIMRMIGFRDLLFSDSLIIKEVNRYGVDGKALKVGSFELLETEETSEGEFYFKIQDIAKKYLNDSKIEITKQLQDNNLKKEFLEEILKRINDFENWFVPANRNFMNIILTNEIDYVNSLDNKKVEKINLRASLHSLKQLNQTKIIMQIGKETNFIVKTFGIAFGKFYENYFDLIFSPAVTDVKKLKMYSGIEMMPLINVGNKGQIPLGFIEVEL